MQLRDAHERSNRLHITLAWDMLIERMVDRAGSTTEEAAQSSPGEAVVQQDDEEIGRQRKRQEEPADPSRLTHKRHHWPEYGCKL